MTEPRFAIIIVIHDSAHDLEQLLESIHLHLMPAPQVIVVDSGSSDGGAERARAQGAEVIQLDGNPGFGAANNAGIGRVREAVCVLLNPDIRLLDDGLLRLVELAARRSALMVPRLVGAGGDLERSAHPVPGTVGALLPALVHPRLLSSSLALRFEPWRARKPRQVGWAIAACLVARTEILQALGPFDAKAFLFYEDLDLCLRARANGVPTELWPEIALFHAGAHSTGPAFRGEPHELLARRRREVVAARLGRVALLLDDAAQGLTFTTRLIARGLLRRPARRELEQLRALARARSRPLEHELPSAPAFASNRYRID